MANEVAEKNVNTEVSVKENTQLSAQKSNNKVTDYSLGIFGTSDNFIMAMQMAKALAESTIVPQTYQNNPSNCLIAIEQAQRMNISPLMVMQNLYFQKRLLLLLYLQLKYVNQTPSTFQHLANHFSS